MTPAQRLVDAGISLPQVARPVGSYVPAKVVDGLVHVSGQLAFVDGRIMAAGVLGAEVSTEEGVAAARAAALNSLAAAADAAGGVDRLGGVVHVFGFLACVQGYADMSTVLNGASDLFPIVFGDAGMHTRTNVASPWLPLGSPVEIQILFQLRGSTP